MAQATFIDHTSPLQIENLYCIGRNYVEHARELNNPIPEQPLVFLKPTSSIIYDGETIRLPKQSTEVHFEVELLLLIGKGGRDIPPEQAREHIAGYGVGIDITARDIQQAAKEKGHPWSVAKGFDTFAPISRFVPAEQIDPAQPMTFGLDSNGQPRQRGNTELMIFPIESLIAHLSGVFTLQPGDIIFTGTPKGVGALQHGDQLWAFLGEELATLSVAVAQEKL